MTPESTAAPADSDPLAAAVAQMQQLAAAQAAPAPPAFVGSPELPGVPITPPAPDPAAALAAATQEMQRQAAIDGADTRTGAPIATRLAVGAAADPATRLARLRQQYPDAAPIPGTDNFTYTNPDTGKKQTYEPIGYRVPTAGDIASLVPEIAEAVGAVGGGMAGSAAGGPLVGTAAGAAIGATTARDIATRTIAGVMGLPELRTPEQQLADQAKTFAINAAAPVAGRALGHAAVSLLGPDPTAVVTPAYQAAQSLTQSGAVPGLLDVLPAGVASGGGGIPRIESALSQAPFSGGTREAYAQTSQKLSQGVQNLAAREAGGAALVPPADTFGQNVQAIAKGVNDAVTARNDGYLAQAQTAMGGPQAPIQLGAVRQLVSDLTAEQARAPATLAGAYEAPLERANSLLADASTTSNAGTLPLDIVRQARTSAGQAADWDVTRGDPSANMKRYYGALSQDLQTAADAADQGPAGPVGSGAAMRNFNTQWSSYLDPDTGAGAVLGKLSDPATSADALMKMMRSTAPGSTQQLFSLFSHVAQFDPAAVGTLRSGIMQTMGETPEGFDLAKFMQNYAKSQDQAKNIALGQPLIDNLDALKAVQDGVKASAASRNFSNTAGAVFGLTALGTAGSALVSGSPRAAAAALAAPVVPAIAGRLLQSAPAVRWLANAGLVNPASADQVATHMGRLASVAAADPSVAHLVGALPNLLNTAAPPAAPPGQANVP
jgi:hypothetical protein